MDQESLEQLRRIVAEATQGLRGETTEAMQNLHEEMGGAMQGLRAELQRGPAEVCQGIQGVRIELRQDIIAASEENKRHAGVLYDDLQHKIRLNWRSKVSGCCVMRFTQVNQRVDRELRDARALLEASCQELRQRVERLEQ